MAFYYSGLTVDQIRQALSNIAKADDPVRVYDSFILDSTVPDSMREYENINEDDEMQVTTLSEHIRYSTNVVDYFLNHFVFPRYAKQFGIKLQTNAFDLPLVSPDPRRVVARSTGFSGTNDNRALLPSNCPQTDLASLQHTNAMVVTYLLAERNRKYHLAADNQGRRLSEVDLLRTIKKLEIRTLIDAGAMILEHSNADLVRTWLEIDTHAQAAIYFNAKHEAIVRFRQGREMPLIIANITNLEDVLVYIGAFIPDLSHSFANVR